MRVAGAASAFSGSAQMKPHSERGIPSPPRPSVEGERPRRSVDRATDRPQPQVKRLIPVTAAEQRLCEVVVAVYQHDGADPRLGRGVADLVRDAGLVDIGVQFHADASPIGHSRRTVLLDLVRSLRPKILERGLLDERELAELHRALSEHLADARTWLCRSCCSRSGAASRCEPRERRTPRSPEIHRPCAGCSARAPGQARRAGAERLPADATSVVECVKHAPATSRSPSPRPGAARERCVA